MISRFVSRSLTVASVALAVSSASTPANADESTPSDYCKRVTAHAQGDADLLFAPTLALQVIRYPNAREPADASGLQIGSGVQPRAALSLGLVDIYKGFGVLDVAKADCARQASAVKLEETLAQRDEIGKGPALEAKLAFLKEHKAAVDEVVQKAEARLAAQTGTLSEVQELRLHALAFDRQIIATERDLAVLRASATNPPTNAALASALHDYEKHSVALEEKNAHVKKLAPWKFNLTGGVTTSPSVDGFGIAELSYNFGGLFQHGAENRAVEARASEVRTERLEMRTQLERMTRELHASAEATRDEAKLIGAALERMRHERDAIEATTAPNKNQLIATLSLSMLDLEAEQTYLTALADRQAAFGAK